MLVPSAVVKVLTMRRSLRSAVRVIVRDVVRAPAGAGPVMRGPSGRPAARRARFDPERRPGGYRVGLGLTRRRTKPSCGRCADGLKPANSLSARSELASPAVANGRKTTRGPAET